jgi:transglutaminase-like putative cysteine protease
MPTLIALRHRTEYRYERPVILGPQLVRLRPAPHARSSIRSYALAILPERHTRHCYQDPPGNFIARVLFPEPTARFELDVELTTEIAECNPFDFLLDPDAATWPFRYPDSLEQELTPYRQTDALSPVLAAFLGEIPAGPRPTVEMLIALNGHTRSCVDYVTRMEAGVLSPEQTLQRGAGSCRDSAWLLVQAARFLGYAARFVSGYLIQLAEGGEADSADLHAWCEIYLPGAGWIGFDATSGLIAAEGHLPLAASAHPASAAPVTGTVEAAASRFTVETAVTRL